MKRVNRILVPTDLSEHSRRALVYSCGLAAEEKAALTILHVVNDPSAWEFYADDPPLSHRNGAPLPVDRVLAEKSIDLNRFLEPSMPDLRRTAQATKRVVLGSVPEQIAAVAKETSIDLIVMSPRGRGLRRTLFGSVTDIVTRTSPCPVLTLAPPQPSNRWRGHLLPFYFPWPRRIPLGI
ncbi:MAG TPA: universal stress protein [Candidatus Binatia bacterium]|nr:universal stress protein [Candidatus Binatia bacterium]